MLGITVEKDVVAMVSTLMKYGIQNVNFTHQIMVSAEPATSNKHQALLKSHRRSQKSVVLNGAKEMEILRIVPLSKLLHPNPEGLG